MFYDQQPPRKFIPIYDEIAEASKQTLSPVSANASSIPVFGRINCNEKKNKPLLEKQHIMSFPTLKIHTKHGAIAEEFDGEHKLQVLQCMIRTCWLKQ